METSVLKLITKKPLLQDFVEHKPCCVDADFTMPLNYNFKDKLETIMLHSCEIVAFARCHNNLFMIDFLNFNKLTWETKLSITINISARNFVTFLGETDIIYFIILDPKTTVIRFNEKSWSYEIINIFDDSSKFSFINDQYVYFVRKKYIYCLDLPSIFDDEDDFLSFQKIDPNTDELISNTEEIEINIIKKDENDGKSFDIPNNEKKKRYKAEKYVIEHDYFDQKKIFATQKFSHYNLIYQNDEDLPLIIYDTYTCSFCFEKELYEKKDYFKRKISSIYPLNEAKFMPIPGKNNVFFLFHDFESYQNAIIPFHEPFVIQECQNENEEPLILITVSVRRISPIIGMFSLPGESFNFFSVSSAHYYEFYKSCGLLLFINQSRNIINSKQRVVPCLKTKNLNLTTTNEGVAEIAKKSENSELPPLLQKQEHNLLSTNKFENKPSPIDEKKIEDLNANDLQQNENITGKNDSDNEKVQMHFFQKDIPLIKGQTHQPQIKMIMHYLSFGPLKEVGVPYIEASTEPEYHMIIHTPRIPHCIFIKNVEVIVTCTDNNDVLSFFLKPSTCINPQKVEVKCSPNTRYNIRIKVSNGCQNTFSKTLEFITPNPGIPPKVEDFFGTFVSDDVYIFKWKAVSDLYNVKYYVLEGCQEDPVDPKPVDITDMASNINEETHICNINELPSQQPASEAPEDNFEFIVELSNDIQYSNICGAKLKINTPYKQFRIRALNLVGIGEPSNPCQIGKNTKPPQKKTSPRISQDQVQYLSEYYSSNPYPNFNERNKIAELLSLSYQTVNSWFARKRHIEKVNSTKSAKNNAPTEKENHFTFELFD